MFDLRVEIYKKLVLEKEENLKFQKNIEETVKLKNQKDNFSETPEQKNFNDFLEQIKEEQKNININWFKNVFNYKTPDEMLKYLHSLETIYDYNKATSFADFEDEVKTDVNKKKVTKKNKWVKILNIVNNILNFTLKERKTGQRLKISTPNQMFNRLPITLAQLKAGNNSEKLKNETRQLFILCTDQKNLQNNYVKVWLTLSKNGNNLYEHWK